VNKNYDDATCKSYDKIFEWFDQSRSKNLIEKEYLDLVIQHVPAGSVLDLGCGAGEPLARFFIENGYFVTGIDGSQKMIELCHKRFPGENFFVADMRGLNLKKKFEVIIAWDSFFHLSRDDQRLMFAVFESHIKPGGILIFTSGPDDGEVWSDNNGQNLYHASLAEKEYRKLLNYHNFEVLKHEIDDPQCQGHTVWVVKFKGKNDL